MIPMIQQDILSHGWVSQSDLIDFIAISESTPGPFAINIATFVGMSKAGLIGAVSATLGVVLPSFLIILIIAKFLLISRITNMSKRLCMGCVPQSSV